MLDKKGADAAVATGMEAKQRREKEMMDHEQASLFESILSCSFAEQQRIDGVKDSARRHPTDTLTLGVIVAMHFALGQRCLNLDDLKWGYMEMTRFSRHQVWEGVLPPYLALRTSSKGDAVGKRKHLAGILHNRDPMRDAIAMLGLYFAYQLFTLQDSLPSIESWLETMHRRPLIRLQSGKGHVTLCWR